MSQVFVNVLVRWRYCLAFTMILVITMACPPLTPAAAQQFRYHYISAADIVPDTDWVGIECLNNAGEVVLNTWDEAAEVGSLIVAVGGIPIHSVPDGYGNCINDGGTVGGSLTIGSDFLFVPALFHKGTPELIPLLPGYDMGYVSHLTDSGVAVVEMFDSDFNSKTMFYKNGRHFPINSPDWFSFVRVLNNQLFTAGTRSIEDVGYRAFRLNAQTGKFSYLNPLPTETHSWGMDINASGNVLGYSFNFSSTERIGIWDHQGRFQTMFVQGTPKYPTISNRLLFNDNHLIVITLSYTDGTSYIVPRAGVRYNLADLVENLPEGEQLFYMRDVNNRGDMIGSGNFSDYLLMRVGGGKN